MASALTAWLEQINAHEHESAALRGGEGGHGHEHGHGHGHGGGSRALVRQDNPDRTDDPVLNALFKVVDAFTTVLDVGGGTGRYAIPLASRAKHVTVVEPSGGSVEVLESIAAERGIANITTIQSDWDTAEVEHADIVLCSVVLHHVPDAEPFILKLAQKATGQVMIAEMVEFPGIIEVPFWERVYGSAPTPLPGLPELLNVLWEMDIYPDVTMFPPKPVLLDDDKAAAADQLRRRLSVKAGSTEAYRLESAMTELLQETPDGLTIKGVNPRRQGIVSWRP
jgi:SAM-dependent methyltransferase